MIKNKIIAIDYDGTCTEKNEYPNLGVLRDGLKGVIDLLQDNGNILILNTCRKGKELQEAIDFLEENKIHFDYVNENVPFLIEKYGDCRKIYADIYIDDNNFLQNKDINWYDIFRYFLSY